jgi:dTDP-4-dehydrorhamnose 3,5-epimerase
VTGEGQAVQRLNTRIDGPMILSPVVHGDQRGFFLETYRQSSLSVLGLEVVFVQENHSRSSRGVVRGMHFQPGMAKLIRCARGSILDVVVDLRRGSPTFAQWEAFQLDDETHHQLY